LPRGLRNRAIHPEGLAEPENRHQEHEQQRQNEGGFHNLVAA
jgi:hypothetical protein